MRKLLRLTFMLLMGVLVLSSCSSSDDEDESGISEAMLTGYKWEDDTYSISFYKNHSFVADVKDNGKVVSGGLTYNMDDVIGTWSLQGNTIVFSVYAKTKETLDFYSTLTYKDGDAFFPEFTDSKGNKVSLSSKGRKVDNGDASEQDNSLVGKWTCPNTLDISIGNQSYSNVSFSFELKKDGTATVTYTGGYNHQDEVNWSTSKGLLKINNTFLDKVFYEVVNESIYLYYKDGSMSAMTFRKVD